MLNFARISGVLLLLWMNLNTCLLQTSSPRLSLNGQCLSNHSYVDFENLEESHISCVSDSQSCCSDQNREAVWVDPNGVEIESETGDDFSVEYGEMVVELGLMTEDVQPVSGLYSCDARVRGYSSHRNKVYVGLYTSGGDVEVSQEIEFTEVSDLHGDNPQFTLTCISTGGPASSLLWIRDLMYPPGERETVLVDPAAPRYIHTLTVTGRLPGNYKCIVSNNKPSQDFAVFTVKVGIAPNLTMLCQASSTSLRIDWSPPMPLGDTTGYRVIYFTSERQPVISSPPLSVATTSYLLTDVVNERLYFISVEGLSEHFSSEVVFSVTGLGVAPHCSEDGGVEMAAPSLPSPSPFILPPSISPYSPLFMSPSLPTPTAPPLSLSPSPLATFTFLPPPPPPPPPLSPLSSEGVGNDYSCREEGGKDENMVILTGVVGLIVGGVAGCLATGGLVCCVHWSRPHISQTQSSNHSSPRADSENVAPQFPEVTGSPPSQAVLINWGSEVRTTNNLAYNSRSSNLRHGPLRDDVITMNEAYDPIVYQLPEVTESSPQPDVMNVASEVPTTNNLAYNFSSGSNFRHNQVVYQLPEITGSSLPSDVMNRSSEVLTTNNLAYNFSSSSSLRDDSRDENITVNEAYGLSPLHLRQSHSHPAPPSDPPPIYYGRVKQ